RSPIRAPPLCYFHDPDLVAVSSVPRTLFAVGVDQNLNEAHLADAALVNFTDPEQTYFKGVSRVPTGSIVELTRHEERKLRQYYDPLTLPAVRMANDKDYISRAKELLDEGVRACLLGFEKPALSLSGGLDSPQVAVSALAALPEHQRLNTFTFHPEPGYDGLVEEGMIGDERPLVKAFARMHPRIDAHFTDNGGYEHDHRWTHFFHLMGGAPSGFCNSYVSHGIFSNAAKQGCDILLLADRGNESFSDAGSWATVEYFLTGRWRQLHMALAGMPARRKSFAWRFIAHSLLPLMPKSVWRLARRVAFGEEELLLDLLQPLSPTYRAASGADERLRRSGNQTERYPPRSRRLVISRMFKNDDHEVAEIYQAFEQMYGIAQRDPTAYRPLVEFCLGLPTEMFFRDGEMRWLAKEMAKGIMPEEQRANRLNGRWDADWHLRIGRRRSEFLAELDRIATDERLSGMFDIPRLRKALEEWPAQTETNKRDYFSRELGVPRALLVARFINYVEGRNQS
ncbi:MAG: asparagine synthase-related protein, partial [Sphingomicrobium sp.]